MTCTSEAPSVAPASVTPAYRGVLYDMLAGIVLARSSVARDSYEQAHQDACGLIPTVASTHGQVDENFAFVEDAGAVLYSGPRERQ